MGKINVKTMMVCLGGFIFLAAIVGPFLWSAGNAVVMEIDLIIEDGPSPSFNDQTPVTKHFEKLSKRNPRRDAFHCYKIGDYRFIAVASVAFDTPGIERSIPLRTTKFLQGGSDYTRSKPEKEMANLVYLYARSYNEKLDELIKKGRFLNFK